MDDRFMSWCGKYWPIFVTISAKMILFDMINSHLQINKKCIMKAMFSDNKSIGVSKQCFSKIIKTVSRSSKNCFTLNFLKFGNSWLVYAYSIKVGQYFNGNVFWIIDIKTIVTHFHCRGQLIIYKQNIN